MRLCVLIIVLHVYHWLVIPRTAGELNDNLLTASTQLRLNPVSDLTTPDWLEYQPVETSRSHLDGHLWVEGWLETSDERTAV